MKDYRGKEVDHAITFTEFKKKWLYYYISNCHDFDDNGFLFDDAGVWGFANTPVGFKTKKDCELYNQWRKKNPPPYRSKIYDQ